MNRNFVLYLLWSVINSNHFIKPLNVVKQFRLTMAETKVIQEELEKLIKLQDERNSVHIDWIKTILTISTSITTIIISFKTGKTENNIQLISYIATISLSGIGILSGLLHLFGYVVLHNQSLLIQNDNILSLLRDKKTEMISKINPPKYHQISEKICIISLIISFISLLVYGISIEF